MYSELINTLSGMAVGALITWWAARYYYEKASRDLAAEAKELKRLNVLMLRALELIGPAEFARDNEGNIKGMVHRASGNLVADSALISATDTVTPKKEER
jgi:hypothetical protein